MTPTFYGISIVIAFTLGLFIGLNAHDLSVAATTYRKRRRDRRPGRRSGR